MDAAVNEAIPFPAFPRFKTRAEACAWVLRIHPNAPDWLALEVAGDPQTWLREVAKLRG